MPSIILKAFMTPTIQKVVKIRLNGLFNTINPKPKRSPRFIRYASDQITKIKAIKI